MHKSCLTKLVAKNTGIAEAQAELAVNAVFSEIANALAAGKDVAVHAFGTFSVKPAKARTGRNPKTGEPIVVPACNKVKFKAGMALNNAVQ